MYVQTGGENSHDGLQRFGLQLSSGNEITEKTENHYNECYRDSNLLFFSVIVFM